MSLGRDRTTIRRAVRAGVVVAALVGLPLLAWLLIRDASIAGIGVVAGIAAGIVAAAGWLLLAGVLDVWAGDLPGVRRLVVTGVFAVLALLSPYVVLAAVSAAR